MEYNTIDENAEQTWCPLYSLRKSDEYTRASLHDDVTVIQNLNYMRTSLEVNVYVNEYMTTWINEAKCEVIAN